MRKLARILDALKTASSPKDMNFPWLHLHPLKGDLSGYWAVSVSGNWRAIFAFDGIDVVNVDYHDYHRDGDENKTNDSPGRNTP